MLALFNEKNSSLVIQRHLLLKVLSAQEKRKDVLLVVHIIVISIVISIKKRLYSTQHHLFYFVGLEKSKKVIGSVI